MPEFFNQSLALVDEGLREFHASKSPGDSGESGADEARRNATLEVLRVCGDVRERIMSGGFPSKILIQPEFEPLMQKIYWMKSLGLVEALDSGEIDKEEFKKIVLYLLEMKEMDFEELGAELSMGQELVARIFQHGWNTGKVDNVWVASVFFADWVLRNARSTFMFEFNESCPVDDFESELERELANLREQLIRYYNETVRERLRAMQGEKRIGKVERLAIIEDVEADILQMCEETRKALVAGDLPFMRD